jgi:kynurenine formamidase
VEKTKQATLLSDLLKDDPKNWGKWGPDDEVGALNYLTSAEVLRGISAVRQGKTFTLQIRMNRSEGDPVWPGRFPPLKFQTLDKGDFLCGKGPEIPGGAEYADDVMVMCLQGSTHYDALGHFWYDDHIWNGYDARTTAGTMEKASVLPLAERGIVGHGVLIDIARHFGKTALDSADTFTHLDLQQAAKVQGSPIQKRDILLVHTGWLGTFNTYNQEDFHKRAVEPGLTYSPALVSWFHEMEIPNLVTDTFANEVILDADHHVVLPLHNALMRNLGVTFTELADLDALAADCRADGQFTFLYVAAPLKISGATGSPVNPVVIK